jgi:hypothetical protein
MRLTHLALPSAALLGLLLACTSSGAGGESNATATVQAAFQKRVLAPNGTYTMTTLPARYCYVEFHDNASGSIINGSGGFLDGTGQGAFSLPSGQSVYAQVYAAWQVPGASSSSYFMQGEVVNATYGTAYNSTTDWYVTSSTFTAGGGTLNILALDDANRIAGAFSVADQGVTFALGMKGLAPATPLPNLAVYWTTSTTPSNQYRAYPQVMLDGSNNLILQNGHALFQAAVLGNASGAPNTEQDEWDDGTLGETYAHLLFAPYSYRTDGSSALSYLRADSENVPFISLNIPAEPSQAFITGYADFLSAAFRNNPWILDSYRDGSGVLQVQNEDLSQPANLGEFSRYGVAGSLWSMWQALGGGQAGLQSLWNATLTTNSGLDFVGDYNGSPLGCYPTYLVGLRAAVGSSWPACQTALGTWGVSDPSAAYFASSSALWTNEATPFSVSGATLATPASNASKALAELCYDRTGAALYRFTQGSTLSRTITLTPSGQDFELDLLGPNGAIAYSYSPISVNPRVLTKTLAAGSYVIRVRVNPDNTLSRAAGTYSYSLSLN